MATFTHSCPVYGSRGDELDTNQMKEKEAWKFPKWNCISHCMDEQGNPVPGQLDKYNGNDEISVEFPDEAEYWVTASRVDDMFRHISFRGCEKKAFGSFDSEYFNSNYNNAKQEPENLPDCETDNSLFVFIHGLNVCEEENRNWKGRMFKRLYRTGINCRFINVDWNGDGWMPFGMVPVDDDERMAAHSSMGTRLRINRQIQG